MSAVIAITRAGPLATIQDLGRFGMLVHGISAAGVMDRTGYFAAGLQLGSAPAGAIEITSAGLDLRMEEGACRIGLAGGQFTARHNGRLIAWPGHADLATGDTLAITPGAAGNYGYLRFDAAIDVPTVLGSIATSTRARLGGLAGRALVAGDRVHLRPGAPEPTPAPSPPTDALIRIVWGLHADLFAPAIRQAFIATSFTVSSRLDRMGVRLTDPGRIFASSTILSLVSDAIVPGDIQILGDGTPIVLMRDHQPTGGYPRIGTIIAADLDRFAQLRPGTPVAFRSVTVEHAQQLLRARI